MTMGRKPQPTAHGIITSSLHHQQSEPGSLVIPILIYTQNRDILHREPEVTRACTAGLNSVFVAMQMLWSSGVGPLRQWGQCLSSESVPHLFLCDRDTLYLPPSISLYFESLRLTALSLLTKKHHFGWQQCKLIFPFLLEKKN